MRRAAAAAPTPGADPVRIAQRRVARLHTHLLGVPRDAVLTPALTRLEGREELLGAVGFPGRLEVGQTLLPAALGPRSRFNADGGERVRRDHPEERVSRLTWARWLEHHGAERREVVGVRSRSYRRFPRARVPAPGVDLRVCRARSGRLVIATEALARGADDARMLHAVNLLLELFGECVLLDERTRPLARGRERRLDWETRRPADALDPALAAMPPRARRVAEHRLRHLDALSPDFTAAGRGGFGGCAVFGFSRRGRLVVENLTAGGSTYVTPRGWDEISRLPKATLLDRVAEDAVVDHSPGWEERLREALGAP